MKWFKNLFLGKYKIIDTPNGYAVYRQNWLTGFILIYDTGLTEEYAKSIAHELNSSDESD